MTSNVILEFLIRILISIPALIFFAKGLAPLLGDPTFIQPAHRFWYLPVTYLLFGAICLIPYPKRFFMERAYRCALLIGIFVISAAFFYMCLFPFEYIAPEAKNNPDLLEAFQVAKGHPFGSGFASSRESQGVTLWVVEKPHWSLLTVSLHSLLCAVPTAFYFLKLNRLRHKSSDGFIND